MAKGTDDPKPLDSGRLWIKRFKSEWERKQLERMADLYEKELQRLRALLKQSTGNDEHG
jgi:hypothetical protein